MITATKDRCLTPGMKAGVPYHRSSSGSIIGYRALLLHRFFWNGAAEGAWKTASFQATEFPHARGYIFMRYALRIVYYHCIQVGALATANAFLTGLRLVCLPIPA